MNKVLTGVKTCEQLLAEYKNYCQINGWPIGRQLIFDIRNEILNHLSNEFNNRLEKLRLSAREVCLYNPTKIIETEDKKYLAIRVEVKVGTEAWKNEQTSHVYFFEQTGTHWSILQDAPHLHLQDPFYVENIHGWKIFGGVEVFETGKRKKKLGYRTVFYKYKKRFSEMSQPFFIGPDGMKDIRLVELKNGKIGIFTRPQGGKSGFGKIGYVEVDKLDDLNDSKLRQAKIIENQFAHGEWGGVNDLHILEDGNIAVLGHVAHYEKNKMGRVKNYFAMVFVFNPERHEASDIRIIASAKEADFELQKNKSNIGNVLFGGGLVFEGKTVKLYAGVNDAQAACFEMENPFLGTYNFFAN